MPLIEWANDNEGYVDFIGHISAIQQRRQLLVDQAIQKSLLSENIEVNREALSLQKQVQLEQKEVATWQDILFEIGEALNLIQTHFKIEPHQAYAAWIELEKTVAGIELHHRLFRDLHWKTLCNETLRRIQYIRDNIDSFISPSQRRTFEKNLLKIQRDIEEEQGRLRAQSDREAEERERTLASERAKEKKATLRFYSVIGILFCLWLARQWASMILTVASTVLLGVLVFRVISWCTQRRERQQSERSRICSNCNQRIEDTQTNCPQCVITYTSRQKKRKAPPRRKSSRPLVKKKFCNRCPGKLIPIKADQNSMFDLVCEQCGRETWFHKK